MISYKFNIPHLSLEEEGVYRLLLDYYYATERPIPKNSDDIIRRLRLQNFAGVFDSVLNEFFVLKNDGWHNSYADNEIEKYHLKLVESHAEKAMMES